MFCHIGLYNEYIFDSSYKVISNYLEEPVFESQAILSHIKKKIVIICSTLSDE